MPVNNPVVVTDTGFAPDGWNGLWQSFDAFIDEKGTGTTPDTAPDVGLILMADTDPAEITTRLAPHLAHLPMIRVDFTSSADGRGFTLARLLRLAGFTGRLRALGDVLSDQYAMARRAGFDEVEIDAERAARQPEAQWLFRADWQAHDYQSRLRAKAISPQEIPPGPAVVAG